MRIEDRLCFLTLLCLASQNEGTIKKCDEEAIIQLSHLYEDPLDDNNEVSRARGSLKRFEEMSMITIDNESNVTLLNYLKRQETNLTNYERVKRFRQKQKVLEYKGILDNKSDNNDNVIIDNARLDKNREEKIRKDNTNKHDVLGVEIIKEMETIDAKNKTYYGNKTQRTSCDFLLKEYGLEKVLKVLEIIKEKRGEEFFPSITSPYELQQKWTKIGEALLRKKSQTIKKTTPNYIL